MKKLLLTLFGVVTIVAALAAVSVATAGDGDQTQTHKVWVCKYVGKPGVDERLKDGKNPIQVDGDATVGTWFKDGQDNSFVLDVVTDANTDQGEKYIGSATCPDGSPPPPEDQTLAVGVSFTEATCDAGPSVQFTKTNIEGVGLRPFYNVEPDPPFVAGGTYTFTAIPVPGYTFGDAQTVFTHTFDAAPTNCTPPPPPPPSQCPPGMTPTAGKDGEPGNDECEFPKTPEPPVTTPAPPVTTPVTPVTPVTPKPVVKPKPKPKAVAKPKAKPKAVPVAKPKPKKATKPNKAPQKAPYTL